MRRQHLSGVRDLAGMLFLLSASAGLQGCAMEPHQLAPANRMPASITATAPPAFRPVAAPAPRAVVAAARPVPRLPLAVAPPPAPAPAPAPARRPAPAPTPARRPGDAWQALPGATYAAPHPAAVAAAAAPVAAPATAPVAVAAAAPVAAVPPPLPEAPVLRPVSLRQPVAAAVPEAPALSGFGDAEAQAVRFAGGRCSDRVYRLAWSAAEQFHVQPAFVAALIEAESGCRSDAVSVAGAHGLMQLVPEAGAREGYRFLHGADHRPTLAELRDPATNIQLGVAYLGVLQDHFYFVQSPAARLVLMIAAYNCGPDFIDQRLPENAAAWTAGQAADWVRRRTPAETRAFVVAVTEKAALYASAAAAVHAAATGGTKKNL